MLCFRNIGRDTGCITEEIFAKGDPSTPPSLALPPRLQQDDGRPFRGDEQAVFEDIMMNYNKHMRPVRNNKEMVVVDFTVKIKQIIDIHGFIAGRSCTTQFLEVLDEWTRILDDGGSVDVVFMDFMKAFDTVPHHRLLSKLQALGVKEYGQAAWSPYNISWMSRGG
nr:uncharacterized protein LOC129259433 [Lytechinus pictus]